MLRAIAILWILAVLVSAQSGPVREVSSPAIIGGMLPAFYNGYLYAVAPDHVVTLFAPDGQFVLTLPIRGRANGKVFVESVAIDSDGTLAVGWLDSPNAGIDIRDPLGNLIRSIDTGRFIPSHLSFGEDHSLWSFGWQRDATRPAYPDSQDYLTVRKYSTEGKETGSYLPRSLFPHGMEPGTDQRQERRITVTSDRVGITAISGNNSGQKEWVELDINGNLVGRWKLPVQYLTESRVHQ